MEIVSLNITGSYYYKPNSIKQINNTKKIHECIICKKSLNETSDELLNNNKNILNNDDILIGKCGHIYHENCINKWLEHNSTCPIDNIKWHLDRKVDTVTKLVLYEKK